MAIPNLDPLGSNTTFSMIDASARNNGAGAGLVTEDTQTQDSHFKKDHLFYSGHIYELSLCVMCCSG